MNWDEKCTDLAESVEKAIGHAEELERKLLEARGPVGHPEESDGVRRAWQLTVEATGTLWAAKEAIRGLN